MGWKTLSAFALCIALSFLYGLAAGVYRIFPYDQVSQIKDAILGPTQEPMQPRQRVFSAFSPDVDVVFIGDSITESGLWSEFFPEYKVANRGVLGDTAEAILARIDTVTGTTPELSLIMVGINDVQLNVPVQHTAEQIGLLIDALQSAGSRVILQSTLECSRLFCNEYLDDVRALNALLVDLGDSKGVQFVDLNAHMSDADGLRSDLTFDGIHLTGAGYRAWVGVLRDAGIL